MLKLPERLLTLLLCNVVLDKDKICTLIQPQFSTK